MQVQEQFIHCLVHSKDLKHSFACTVVYGLNTVEERKVLWRSLQGINIQAIPWLIAGDFHAILSCEDRINGEPVAHFETRDFSDFLVDVGLTEIKSKGPFFSWSNKGSGTSRIASRIDRGIVNQCWMQKYPNVEYLFLPPWHLRS